MEDILLRSLNWCKRFRHRKGYGIHSPSDFFLTTFVIYEQMPFYAYAPLHHLRRVVNHLPHYREKVDKLLFRLINYLQPSLLIEAETGSGISTRYMAEALYQAAHPLIRKRTTRRSRTYLIYQSCHRLSMGRHHKKNPNSDTRRKEARCGTHRSYCLLSGNF